MDLGFPPILPSTATVSKWNTLVVEGPPFAHYDQRSTGNASHGCVPSSFFCTPGRMTCRQGVPAPYSMGTFRLRHRPRSLRGRPCGHRPAYPGHTLARRDLSAVEGAARTVTVNEVIRAECKQCHQVSFWEHKGFMNLRKWKNKSL